MLPEMADGGSVDALLVFPLHLKKPGRRWGYSEAPLLQFVLLRVKFAALEGGEPDFELPAVALNDSNFRADGRLVTMRMKSGICSS